MLNTFTRKVHQGQIQKKINEEEAKKKEMMEKEELENKNWSDPSKGPTLHELKMKKEEERKKKKEELQELYEKEMEETQ
jgi:hypothetical protein